MGTLTICLTRVCNFRCVHCYIDAHKPRANELTTRELVDLFEQAVDLGFKKIDFSGGEPLLREDLVELCAVCRHLGLETSLVTNGSLLDERKAGALAAAGLGCLFVSLHGDQSSHTMITRRENAYLEATRAVSLAVRSGMTVGISTCVTTINSLECEALALQMAKRGANLHGFLYFCAVGGATTRRNLCLSAEQWSSFRTQLSHLSARNPELQMYIEPSFSHWSKGNQVVNGRCEATNNSEKTLVTVDADGRVYPCCLLINWDRCAVGDVRQESLRVILVRHVESAGALRDVAVLPTCRTCDKLLDCGGGCLAHALSQMHDHRCTSDKQYRPICPLFFASLRPSSVQESAL